MKFSILGSCTILNFPTGVVDYFKGEHLIDPRNKTFMEMDAYSLYLIGKKYESKELIMKVVKGLLKNIDSETGFWMHNAWGQNEVHLRFTANALKTLTIAYKDGEFSDFRLLTRLIKKHISFKHEIEFGSWYLHDSIEYNSGTYPKKTSKNNIYGSNRFNTLTLNTHLDTINTLLFLLNENICDSESELNNIIKSSINDGIQVLFQIARSENMSKEFQMLDNLIRATFFKLQIPLKLIRKPINGVFKVLYFDSLRFFLRKNNNGFFYSSGFIERDLCLNGRSFEYHVVNCWDLARLLLQVHKSDKISVNMDFLKHVIQKGINYIIKSGYLNYIKISYKNHNIFYIEICEVLVILFQFGIVNDSFINLYLRIRKIAPPCPALKAFDPFVYFIGNGPLSTPYTNIDLIKIAENKYFIANMDDNSCDINIVESKVFNITGNSAKCLYLC